MNSTFLTQKHFTRISGHRGSVRPLGRDGRVPLTAQAAATFHVPCIVSHFTFLLFFIKFYFCASIAGTLLITSDIFIVLVFLLFVSQNDDLATAWLNDESVRKAIHAAPVMYRTFHHSKVHMRRFKLIFLTVP